MLSCLCFQLFLRERPDDYFPTILSIETWQSSYTENLQPVEISEIDEAAETIYANYHRKSCITMGKGGRKRKARMEAG